MANFVCIFGLNGKSNPDVIAHFSLRIFFWMLSQVSSLE